MDWERLLGALPEDVRLEFEHQLRHAVRRRWRRDKVCECAEVPGPVRAQAVGIWRERHMADASKNARRRMSYEKIKDMDTYRAIEREIMVKRGLWGDSRGLLRRANEAIHDSAELMRTCLSLWPKVAGSPVENNVWLLLVREYQGHVDADEAADALEKRVLKALSTHDLSRYVPLRLRMGSASSGPFSLAGATTPAEVASLVRDAHLVEGVLATFYGKASLDEVAKRILVTRLCARQTPRALEEIIYALYGDDTRVERLAARVVRSDAHRVAHRLGGKDMVARAAEAVLSNEPYRKQYERSVELMCRVRENVPETPMDAYPLARTMRRHFVVHVGETNSGKTHDAMRALGGSASGCYLGPLRLLAFEQFERLNVDGCPCTLLTGEEHMEVAGARHVASTVEMANLHRQVEVAVIDEAQMLADPERGHAWTQAILGIPADVVHVTCAPQALDVVCDLVRLCEDEAEVVWHDRLVPLRFQKGRVRVPEGVQKGDALVVFSRRSVHAYAAKVQEAGLRASVVYGALPYDVRQEEARRFDAGETDVVVATDAIGMGMNLPIRRVVFCEQEKFDGRSRRLLEPQEIQQIAGRAGRFGRYAEGLFASCARGGEVRRRYMAQVADISEVPVGIPEDICLVRDATLTDAIVQWMAIEQPAPFRRIDVERDLELITYAEGLVGDRDRLDTAVKTRILALARIPFDEDNPRLKEVWRQMAASELLGVPFEVEPPAGPVEGADLATLEADYRLCDLLYTYARSFGYHEREQPLMELRGAISRSIMALLARS